MSETDQLVFDSLVPAEHYVRRALAHIDFQRFRPLLAPFYSADHGRPAIDPVLMLKLSFLQFHDNLSDAQVIMRARTDVAYRFFLGLGMKDALPDPSLLSIFRGRLGVEGYGKIFHDLVAQAREHKLIRDRLRIKDATHVIADVAIPTTLRLLAEIRTKLLTAARPFDLVRVDGELARAEMIRQSTAAGSIQEQLVARVTHLREILAWVDALTPPSDRSDRDWQKLEQVRGLAHKILADQQDPEAGDRTRSTVDPDARRGKHGQWYDGYLLDVMIDADSELITAIDVLPANGDEAANAAELLRQEGTSQRNNAQALSIDGIAFQGAVLRELQDPNGLALDVYVPATPEPTTATFRPQDFIEDQAKGVLTCPAGQTTRERFRNEKNTAWVYRFSRGKCAACSLLARCMAKAPRTHGRTVHKNDYEAEYIAMRAKNETEAYQRVRAEHSKIERKLSELVRRHGARRARYRGLWRLKCQELIAAIVVNAKRLIGLRALATSA